MKVKGLKRSLRVALIATVIVGAGSFAWFQYKAMRQGSLMEAATTGDDERVREALAQGVDVNRRFGGDRETALHRAASLPRPDLVILLLEHGADPSIADAENSTPLLVSSYGGRVENVKLLIRAGARVNEAESRYHFTPLIDAAWKGHTGVVRVLLDNGEDVTATTVDGKTALDKARSEGHEDIVEILSAVMGIQLTD